MRPTRFGVLGVLASVAGAAAWALLRVLDSRGSTAPPMPATVPAGLLLVALGITSSALVMRRRLRGDVDTRPMDALSAARMVALAKAAAHAGAVLVGLYTGFALFLLPDAGPFPRRGRLALAAVSVLTALALCAAGLLLERVLRIDHPDEDPPSAPA